MIKINILLFILIIFLLVFFFGLSIFWFKQHNEKDKQSARYEKYYFEKKEEYEKLYKKANRLSLILSNQLLNDITNILVNSDEPDNKEIKVITMDDEYIINTKITKTKSYVFWSDEGE